MVFFILRSDPFSAFYRTWLDDLSSVKRMIEDECLELPVFLLKYSA